MFLVIITISNGVSCNHLVIIQCHCNLVCILMKQKRSSINRQNRAARKTNHCSGTKSFARVSRDLVYTALVNLFQIYFVLIVLKCFIANYLYGIVGSGRGQGG